MRRTTPILAAALLALVAGRASSQDDVDLRELAARPLKTEPAYHALVGYLVIVVGEPEEAKRIVVAVDRPDPSHDPSTAWVDKNSDDKLEPGESVGGAETRDFAGSVTFELGDLDKRFTQVRLVCSGDKKDEIRVSGLWEKKHVVWTEPLLGESGNRVKLSPQLASAPVFRAGGCVGIEFAQSNAFVKDPIVAPGLRYEVHALVGWRGLGEGTFLALATSFLPSAVEPTVKIRYHRKQGADREETFPLRQRALGNSYRGYLDVPLEARPGSPATLVLNIPTTKQNERTGSASTKVKIGTPPPPPKKPDEKKDGDKPDGDKPSPSPSPSPSASPEEGKRGPP